MAQEVWGDGRFAVEEVKRVGDREQAFKTDVCRLEFRPSNAQRCPGKKVLKPCEKKKRASYLIEQYHVSICRACKIVDLQKSMWYYISKRDDKPVIDKLNKLAEEYPTRGFDDYYNRIRNEGLKWNRKRVLRIYRNMGLPQRRKRKRRLPARIKQPLEQPLGINQNWSMDFMSDSLSYGRKFRVLNIIDDYNREALTMEIDFSITGERVVRELDKLAIWRGIPRSIRVDNGPEFLSKAFKRWCGENNVEIKYIQPGKPVQNAYIERFNRLYREDILDAYMFESLEEVIHLSNEWIQDYNYKHPHKSLGWLSPITYFEHFPVEGTLNRKMNKQKKSNLVLS